MVSDTILILILSSILTLTASLTTILVTNFVNSKQKQRDKNVEDIQKIKTNLYSPLLFSLFETSDTLAAFAGIFGAKNEEFNEIRQKQLLSAIKEKLTELNSSDIRKLLLKEIAFVKPDKFRNNLFYFQNLLRTYESVLIDLADNGFCATRLDLEKKWLLNLGHATLFLLDFVNKLEFAINEFISKNEIGVNYPEINQIKIALNHGLIVNRYSL